MITNEMRETFLDHVEVTSNCWAWKGNIPRGLKIKALRKLLIDEVPNARALLLLVR